MPRRCRASGGLGALRGPPFKSVLDERLEIPSAQRVAQLAVQAGLRGLVCSPLEIVDLRQILPEKIQLVTPGIRTGPEQADDQKRTLTPREALDAGATWRVIGRPIYAATNPREAAESILKTLT